MFANLLVPDWGSDFEPQPNTLHPSPLLLLVEKLILSASQKGRFVFKKKKKRS